MFLLPALVASNVLLPFPSPACVTPSLLWWSFSFLTLRSWLHSYHLESLKFSGTFTDKNVWPVWCFENLALSFPSKAQSLYCKFLIFFFWHWMLISLKMVLLKCSLLSYFSSPSDKSILCSHFVRLGFFSPLLGSVIFCWSISWRALALMTLVGHSQRLSLV